MLPIAAKEIHSCDRFVAINDINIRHGKTPSQGYVKTRRVLVELSISELETGTPHGKLHSVVRRKALRGAGFSPSVWFLILRISLTITRLVILWWAEYQHTRGENDSFGSGH